MTELKTKQFLGRGPIIAYGYSFNLIPIEKNQQPISVKCVVWVHYFRPKSYFFIPYTRLILLIYTLILLFCVLVLFIKLYHDQ